MSAYYLPWVLLIIVSLWVSLAGFFWALRHGQFSEQERARYLPLRAEITRPALAQSSRAAPEVYAMLVVLCMGGLVLLALVVILLMKPAGG
jgi:nitrogen fixation-related uncharacterized protein